MTSFKQFEANRRNARKSTGPTTEEGKQRSRCNAVRQGLTAETVIGADNVQNLSRALEDAEDLHVFAKLFEDCLKRGLEARAFSGREIGGNDDVLDFLVGHFVDVGLTRQPASYLAFSTPPIATLPKVLINHADYQIGGGVALRLRTQGVRLKAWWVAGPSAVRCRRRNLGHSDSLIEPAAAARRRALSFQFLNPTLRHGAVFPILYSRSNDRQD
jgi:hypothetical protein